MMNSVPNKKQLQKLVQKFLDGNATEEEIVFLQNYYAYHNRELNILDSFSEEQKAQLSHDIVHKILHNIHSSENHSGESAPLKRRFYGWAAAVVIVLLVAGGYIFIRKQSFRAPQPAISQITPGHDGAILTLSNGTKILLDSSAKNNIAVQGNVSITNSGGGIISYSTPPGQINSSAEITYNTLETPRGRRFKIILPDGTQVWLNSASSLKYPTAFAGNERNVELTGEAYFEVVHNPAMPFIVHTKRADVRVLGTGFNVMAYDDENSERTTLVHGLVQVSSTEDKTQQAIIHPGQQAVLPKDQNVLAIRKADTSEVLAWLNGKFIFDNGSIQYVMRQIARWYDLSIQYQGDMSNIRFEGILSKRDNIQDILEAIQTTNEVHFKIEGKTITVIAGK